MVVSFLLAYSLHKDLSIPRHIVDHCVEVSKEAEAIAGMLKCKVDFEAVRIGGLLHDIGKYKSRSMDHGYIGGLLVRNVGFPRKIVRIVETHILGGLNAEEAEHFGLPPMDFQPRTIEEKVVCYADKLYRGREYVGVEARFERFYARLGKRLFLIKSYNRVISIEKELEGLGYNPRC